MLQPIWFMLWRNEEMMGVTWISWDHLATPKRLGGATILDLERHLMARRFTLLQDICKQYQPWISMRQYFIEHDGFVHGKTKIQALWWPLRNGCILLKIRHSVCGQHLVRSWHNALSLFEWGPSSD